VSDTPIDPSRFNLLVVDDEKNIRFSLTERFREIYASARSAANGEECYRAIDEGPVDVVLLDQNLKASGESGLDLLREIRERAPHVVVIIMTAFGRFEQAMEAARLGCMHYVSKPLDLDQIDLLMRAALQTMELEREVARLRETQRKRYRVNIVFGEESKLAGVVGLATRVAKSASSTVLVTGETGVGKELVAQLVHYHSPRSHGDFVEVNCSAIHENLLESELFGHERGAFTDARRTKPGLFELADGGTLFLDEVGEMSPSVQAKLLRVLETHRFRRVGGTEDRRVDVRVVAATNRELQEMVREGKFREDLFYRLSVIPVVIPPLRERQTDIPLLVRHFVDLFNSEFHLKVRAVSDDAMARLMAHRWSGNIRELRNVIERTMLTIDGDEIRPEHLPPGFEGDGATRKTPGTGAGIASDPEEAIFAPGRVPTLSELEHWGIRRAMQITNNNKTRSAELLGISRQTLRMKLREAEGADASSASNVPH